MKRSFKLTLTAALAAGLSLLWSDSARADGLLLKASDLDAAEKATLVQEIAAKKAQNPGIFSKVRDVSGVKPEVYKNARNPVPVASRELRALGKEALLPMLEALVLDASQKQLAAHEREALVTGMLTALGQLQDARALPVLRKVLEKRTTSDPVALSAARALGASCGSAEVKLLSSYAKAGHALESAAVSGLGECRTRAAAQALVSYSRTAQGANAVRALDALGTLSSSWAWAAKGKLHAQEGAAVRDLVASELADVFVKSPSLRPHARRALLKTEAKSVVPKLESARAAAQKVSDQKTAAELGALIDKLSR